MTGSARVALRSATAAAFTGLLTMGGVGLFWLAGSGALDARTSGPDAPADLLVLGAAGAGAVLLLWFGLGATLAALATLPGTIGRVSAASAERVTPAAVRRMTAVVLGATLATAATPVAHAGGSLSGAAPSATTSQTVMPPAPDPAFGVTARPQVTVTDRPPVADAAPDPGRPTPATAPDPAFGAASTTTALTDPAARTDQADPAAAAHTDQAAPNPPALGPLGPAPQTPSTGGGPRTVTVIRGDSLWSIAHRHLGAHATAQQIAGEWPRWYAANRGVIGSNPNLIRAGQVLTVPTSGPS